MQLSVVYLGESTVGSILKASENVIIKNSSYLGRMQSRLSFVDESCGGPFGSCFHGGLTLVFGSKVPPQLVVLQTLA